MYSQPRGSSSSGLPQQQAGDPYANNLARHLSVAGASSADVIANLRSMNLGDDWWMFEFKASDPSSAPQGQQSCIC
jgi:hypothetical protein